MEWSVNCGIYDTRLEQGYLRFNEEYFGKKSNRNVTLAQVQSPKRGRYNCNETYVKAEELRSESTSATVE